MTKADTNTCSEPSKRSKYGKPEDDAEMIARLNRVMTEFGCLDSMECRWAMEILNRQPEPVSSVPDSVSVAGYNFPISDIEKPYYAKPEQPVECALNEALKELVAEADNEYCRAMDMGMATLCCGEEWKLNNGKFGQPELDAHRKQSKTMERHYTLHYAVKKIRAALASATVREYSVPLFKEGTFTSHSGLRLSDKIDCDALTDADWKAQAKWFSDRIGFGKVVGVPTGGLKFAEALEEYCSPFGPVLIVDDVLTTGKSMGEARLEFPDAVGAVLFSRTANVPKWITARFFENTDIEDGAGDVSTK